MRERERGEERQLIEEKKEERRGRRRRAVSVWATSCRWDSRGAPLGPLREHVGDALSKSTPFYFATVFHPIDV